MKNIEVVKAILLLITTTELSVTHGSRVNEKHAEEYDVKLSNYIREILENFRSQMGEGIPDIGIPAVDPLSVPNLDEDIQNDIVKMEMRMRQLNVTGLSNFDLKDLKADLERGFVNFSIAVPELMAESYCNMNGKIISIFPINSDGPFFINVTEVNIDGYGDLNITTGGGTRIHMNDLRLDLSFGSLDVKFDSLLGGSKWAQTLLQMLIRAGPVIFNHFHEVAMAKMNEALLTLINEELDQGTLSDMLDDLIPT